MAGQSPIRGGPSDRVEVRTNSGHNPLTNPNNAEGFSEQNSSTGFHCEEEQTGPCVCQHSKASAFSARCVTAWCVRYTLTDGALSDQLFFSAVCQDQSRFVKSVRFHMNYPS
ncbi:hypothetical protein NDU88_002362 [Pleurodeles waltl]|uniref:Uncharacterized protein n=1 Tax=Pleurodeles waltl TaxID=8319 RepID=A0AAV7NIF3_PLEWA|nr:hypothetical protein NDU88_002362 [Pleurodeles waltl]